MPEQAPTVRAFVAIGSNLGDRVATLHSALEALAADPLIDHLQCSPWYRSAPMGPADQPDFLNAVAYLQTAHSPLELLDTLQSVELAHGRQRGRRWGERTLDLDLLLYGERQIDTERLRVPHPGLAERCFVLQPLYDLAPGLAVPGLGGVAGLLQRCDCSGLHPWS